MITLTEKRLQDFERRMIETRDQLTDLKKDSQEFAFVNKSLSNGLVEAQKVSVDISSALISHINQSEKNKQEHDRLHIDSQKHITSHAERVKQLEGDKQNLRIEFENLRLTLADFRKRMIDFQEKQLVASDIIKKLEENSVSNNVDIAHHKSQVKRLEDQSLVHSGRLDEVPQKIQSFQELVFKRFGNIEATTIEIRYRIEKLSQEVQSVKSTPIPVQLNYDSALIILDQKLETVLDIAQNASKSSFDQDKINAKMKVLENSIAEIYSFLKRLESR